MLAIGRMGQEIKDSPPRQKGVGEGASSEISARVREISLAQRGKGVEKQRIILVFQSPTTLREGQRQEIERPSRNIVDHLLRGASAEKTDNKLGSYGKNTKETRLHERGQREFIGTLQEAQTSIKDPGRRVKKKKAKTVYLEKGQPGWDQN